MYGAGKEDGVCGGGDMILGESVGPLIDMAKVSTWVLEIEIDAMSLFAEGSSL